MSSFRVMAFLAVLVVLLPMTALGGGGGGHGDGWGFDYLSPAYPPFSENPCDMVECGKGTCKSNATFPYNYVCECEPGWKRAEDDDDIYDFDFKRSRHFFLPCIIPNCTLNYGTCQPAPPPVPEKTFPTNFSTFDPCNWVYCGEGTCKKTTTYKHTCECNPGFSNLLNISYYPCYSNCTLGSDCSALGITVSNDQTSANHGTSLLPGKFHLMTILMMFIAMALWK
ncbi:hypothetical protein Pint_20528 [Pistacia integerrima]|uniref:Uncharacterized protein n=1 Tax=Pistacia integerrima TaxID=434235 RepID=A0ACC0XBX9_9ROSI|nr:hypothetical protein Pint_20528 [Pistacia integerrima]